MFMWTASLYKPNDKIILTICKTRSLYSLCNQMPSLVTYSFLIVCTMLNFLLARGFPGHIVKVLVDWYGKTFSRVRWNDVFSSLVSIRSGIRHCGILSPFLFNIIMWTHSSRFSDHGSTYFLAALHMLMILFYCQDRWHALLQDMLKLCSAPAEDLNIKFNATESCLLKIGKNPSENIQSLKLGLAYAMF